MNERLKKIRKTLDLTQQEFANRIGVARANIASYEVGKSNLSDAVISLICREFSVNEKWLRYGEGDMFNSSDDEYIAIIDRIMAGENEFAKNIFKTFAMFDEADWNALNRMIEKYNSVEAIESETSLFNGVPDSPEELEKQFPPIEPPNKNTAG